MAVFLFLLISGALWVGFSVDTYFASDGANYFVTILDEGGFTRIAPARAHAEYLSQWPLVLGVQAGITDLNTLEILFGLGLWFPWVLGFVISLHATRGKPELIFFYLISLASLHLSAWSIFIGEHLVLLSVSWPIFFLAIVRRPWSGWEEVLLGLLLVAHLRLYESAVATGTIFAFLFGLRAWLSDRSRERRANLFFVLLSLASVMIALRWIIVPRDSENRSSFFAAMEDALDHPYPWIGVGFVAFSVMGVFFRSRLANGAAWLLPLTVCGFAFFESGVSSLVAFSTRTLSLSVLPFLMGVAFVGEVAGHRSDRFRLAGASMFVVLICVLHVRHLQDWMDFRERFITVIQTEDGFVDPTDHEGLVHWAWTNPLLSYVWSGGEVKAIILSPDPTGFQPFDPRTEVVMPRYLRKRPEMVESAE